MEHFDVVVIGAGPGGYVSAIRAAQKGLKTAIVEGHRLGGECLNYGCIPSKALITVGHHVDTIKNGETFGIRVKELQVSLEKLVGWKAGIVKQLTNGVQGLLRSNKVKILKGTAEFVGVEAQNNNKKILKIKTTLDSYTGAQIESSEKSESIDVSCDNVIVATGSEISELPHLKSDGVHVLNSKQALEVKKIPKKLVVVGGGFIGLEIGTFFSKLGTQVSVVEASDGLLQGTDRDCVAVVQKKLKKNKVDVYLNSFADSMKKTEKGVQLTIKDAKTSELNTIEADWIFVAVGRKPRTQSLNLKSINLDLDDKGFIPVNTRLETSVPGVYAIGDVIGGAMLAHKASKEGLFVVDAILDPKRTLDIKALPWAIFVDPEISSVGHTVESAKQAGWDPVVGKCPFAANGRALTTGHTEGFVKIIADKKTDRILGAHMVGPDVSNLISEVATHIELGGTVKDLTEIVHAHPTLPETILEAAESIHGQAIHIFNPKSTSQNSSKTKLSPRA